MNKKIQIGVIGYAGLEEYAKDKKPERGIYEIAEKVGFLLGKAGAIVVTGGKSGIMESAARGAKDAGGTTIGVIKGNQRFTSNEYTDVEVLSGMSVDGFDELLLVNMCDALIIVGGGAGTLEEIAIAYRNKKPMVAIRGTGGWADKTADTYLDERESVKICAVATPEEAVERAIQLAKQSYE